MPTDAFKELTASTYSDPKDRGFKQFRITRQQHNALFKQRQLKWSHRYEYYYNEDMILLHGFMNPLGVALNILLFPVLLLIHGLSNTKEVAKELKKMLNQKKYIQYIVDTVPKGSEMYDKIMEIIK